MVDYMEALLRRKPLYSVELAETPCTVCLTGGAGYIASKILCRLLAAGHTVHATYRDVDDDTSRKACMSLPGADERLKWFKADLMVPGSFDTAVEGCKYVIHTACPVLENLPTSEGYNKCIRPCVEGIKNVLGAVEKTKTVEKVIMTSSMVAALGGADPPVPGSGSISITEENWATHKTSYAYGIAKMVSECAAYAICAQQKRWTLVTLLAAATIGPPLAPCPMFNNDILMMVKTPLCNNICLPTVDIDDVAAAHTLAMVTKEAKGRYMLCERSPRQSKALTWFRENYPKYFAPYVQPAYWVWWILVRIPGFPFRHNTKYWMRYQKGKDIASNSDKAEKELGLQLIPFETSGKDMIARMEELGLC